MKKRTNQQFQQDVLDILKKAGDDANKQKADTDVQIADLVKLVKEKKVPVTGPSNTSGIDELSIVISFESTVSAEIRKEVLVSFRENLPRLFKMYKIQSLTAEIIHGRNNREPNNPLS